MFEKPEATQTLGLELTSSSLKAAKLSFRRGRPLLDRIFTIAVDKEPTTPDNVKLLYMENEEASFKTALQKNLVSTALLTSEILVRPLEVHLTKEKDIDSVLEFQVEPILPYPVEEGIVDRILLEKGKENTDLTICAVRKDHLSNHIDQWNTLGVEPESVSSIPTALACYSQYFFPAEGFHFLLHFGENQTTCLLLEENKLLAAQQVPQGITHLIEAFAKDTKKDFEKTSGAIKTLDFNSLSSEKHPHLTQTLNVLNKDLKKTLFALTNRTKEKTIEEVMMTGEGGTLNHFFSFLSHSLEKKLVTPQSNISFPFSPAELQNYAVPIGLGLSTLPNNKNAINFRQKEYSYPFPWKRIKKPMALYLSLCFFLSLTFYLFGQAYIGKEEDLIKKQYVSLIASFKKPYSQFEKEYLKKNPFQNSKEVVSLVKLSREELKERLTFLEKELQASPSLFPLFPNIPRVSDVLAWLSTHPYIVGQDDVEEPLSPRLLLESFSYKMVKRPEFNKKKEKYRVKVELEFTTSIPRYAREFHDALLAPNEMIDPKGDVKWSAERGKYRTSFFLKDKTKYPRQ